MLALYYMLDTNRVTAKTIQCLKERFNVYRLNSHEFDWNLAKS